MGGTLGPLVQGSFLSLRRRGLLSVIFALTFMIGAMVTFAIAAILFVGLVRPHVMVPSRVVATAVGLALLSALDLFAIRKNAYCRLSLRRQTPKVLERRLGMLPTVAVWGFDLGTVVSTFRVTSASWGALILVILGWSPPWTGLFYAAGFTLPLLFLMWTGRLPNKTPGLGSASIQALLDWRKSAQWTSAVLLAFGVILAVAGQFA